MIASVCFAKPKRFAAWSVVNNSGASSFVGMYDSRRGFSRHAQRYAVLPRFAQVARVFWAMYFHIMPKKNLNARLRDENGFTCGDRLRELMNAHGLNVAEFARRCGVPGKNPSGTASPWLSNRSLPGGQSLKGITTAFGVTSDWVLHGPPYPKYARSAWATDMLASEIAEHVKREVGIALGYQPEDIEVDGALLLTEASGSSVRRCEDDVKRLSDAAPAIRDGAIVADLVQGFAARAVPDLSGDHDFIVNAARSVGGRVARLTESLKRTGWTGPARIHFDRIRVAVGPLKRVQRTQDERHVMDFSRPRRRGPELEAHREEVLELIVGSESE